jgi:hypothetical protein
MDAVSLIEQDHRHVEDLFKHFETAGPQAYKTKDDLGSVSEVIAIR